MGDNIDAAMVGGNSETFVQHVFNFDEASKKEMMNVVQYTMVGVIPIVILNKIMQKYVPEADDEKGSVELLAEITVQLIVMFLGILIINRIVTFVPTYSGVKYEQFSIIHTILAVLMITLSLQTKLGEKVSIIFDRVDELIMGKREGMENKEDCKKNNLSNQSNYRGPQNPLQNAANPSLPVTSPGMPMTNAPTQAQGTTGIGSLRQDPVSQGQQGAPPQDEFVPIAANDAIGGGAFGSLW